MAGNQSAVEISLLLLDRTFCSKPTLLDQGRPSGINPGDESDVRYSTRNSFSNRLPRERVEVLEGMRFPAPIESFSVIISLDSPWEPRPFELPMLVPCRLRWQQCALQPSRFARYGRKIPPFPFWFVSYCCRFIAWAFGDDRTGRHARGMLAQPPSRHHAVPIGNS